MKDNELLFLGSGAADWTYNARLYKLYFRRNCALLLNGNLLIDCGPHIYDFADKNGMTHLYDNVTHVLISHGHPDHFNIENIEKLPRNITVGCEDSIYLKIRHLPLSHIDLPLHTAVKFGDYTVTSVLANHGSTYNFIIETGDGKKIFYGLDSGPFISSTWEELKKHKFDIMILDCTEGKMPNTEGFGHNSVDMVEKQIREIKENGMLTENGIIVASHFSRKSMPGPKKTEKIVREIGAVAAYDGMKINF